MKHGRTAMLAAVLAALLLVPAVEAKPGNGNGNGHGPPPWAGGGHGAAGKGKPDKAAKQAAKAEKAAQKSVWKAERRAARGGSSEDGADGLKHLNPAWVCKFERERMGADAFADAYGENENKADAFGKCVSREAHDRDGVTPGVDEATTADDGTSGPEDHPGEEPEDPALPASVQAFLHYLWPLFF
jgi:hypothetical protein